MTAQAKRLVLSLGAGVLTLGLTAGVFASTQNTSQEPPPFRGQGGRGPGGRMGGPGGAGGAMGMLPMLGPQLQLTDAQKDQVKAIVTAHTDDWKALADRERTARSALNDAVTADTVDESLIRSRSADVAIVESDTAVARAHAYGEVLQILTADQKTKLKAMEAEMKTRMKNRQSGL
ncbi:MAG TPA: Spy/CpxP family protein refolding chaperone [Vicinamibacterales bacterium]